MELVTINAFKMPMPKEGVKSMSPDAWPQVKINLRRKDGDPSAAIYAVDATRKPIGTVDVSSALGLVPLMDSKLGIRTTSRILSRPRKPDDKLVGADISERFDLDVNLYGPKKHAEHVGHGLGHKNVWLRTPLFMEAGHELVNPHTTVKRPLYPPKARGLGYGDDSSSNYNQRTVEEIRNDVVGMFDKLEKSENLPEMEADSRIITELLPHQKQGLYFMTNKEKARVFSDKDEDNSSLWRLKGSSGHSKVYYNVITGQEERQSPPQVLGGILADMMGLGKTLSILSLIMSTLDESKQWAAQDASAADERQPKKCKTTLLVSPLSTITNWEDQIKQHVKPGALKVHIYHGPNRFKDVNKLAEYDMVITTYGSVASEYGNVMKGKAGNYPLREINWFRVVLDEAHMIREQKTQQSIAICNLEAQRRWAVTGTPIQNRLDDLGALLKFLQIKPFDSKQGFSQYIRSPFKNADPEILPKLRLLVDSITLRRLKDRINLPKRRDRLVKLRFSEEEQALYNVFAKNARSRVAVMTKEKVVGGRAYVHILQAILRLRLICAHGKELLSQDDLKLMAGLDKKSAIDLDSGDDGHEQPALTPAQAYDMYNLMRETNEDTCGMCNKNVSPEDIVDTDGEPKDVTVGYMTPCFHVLCNACIKEFKKLAEDDSEDDRHANCPLCKEYIKMCYFPLKQGQIEENETAAGEIKDGKRVKQLNEYQGPHTKTKALIQALTHSQIESEMSPDKPPIKSVVFSGWTTHLDLISIALKESNVKFVRLDGKMTRNARTAAMAVFRDDPSIPVILVSITAGGLGLNLTTANKVYVMEPQYNPAAEAQAIDRVHRLGQKREVETTRYIMDDSFEEKMLELQEKKKKLASMSMDKDKSAPRGAAARQEATRKRLEDLRSLFR